MLVTVMKTGENTTIPESKTDIPGSTPKASKQKDDPGQVFAIISLVAPFVWMGVVGIIFAILSKKKSKAAGFTNGLATVGLWLSIAQTVLGGIYAGFIIYSFADTYQTCEDLGGGTHIVDDYTYECDPSWFGENKTSPQPSYEDPIRHDASLEI